VAVRVIIPIASEGASLATPANLLNGRPRNRADGSVSEFTYGIARGRRKRRPSDGLGTLASVPLEIAATEE
jgi:hypothetical protein